ncbi:unnamed protein product [Trichobilharzia regenti]|nr:unnamed protein product [Trichobilharzia regenti]
MICVTGPVGSGKSSLLLSILGELQAITPENELRNQNSRLRYAYVGQTPWLHAGTIRENILFGSNYDPTWLNTVIEACALVSDLANLPHGLDTDVGEAGGSRLSGGQRARVALARAVYQKADVYLLDDPLSALDVDVSQLVANNCLLGLLSGKTRIIVTHQLDWFMNTSGLFSHNDDHNNNKNNENGIHTIDHESSVQIDDVDDDDVPLIDTKADITAGTSELNHNNLENGDNNNNDVTMEHIAMGSISPHVYKSYIRAVGYVLTLAVIVSLLLMQGKCFTFSL